MSTDQPTLEDYLVEQHAPEEPEQVADSEDIMEGARYGRSGRHTESHEPADAGCCLNCGRDLRADPDVDNDVLRTLGDNYDRVPVCDRLKCRKDVLGVVESQVKDAVLSRAVNRARSEVDLLP